MGIATKAEVLEALKESREKEEPSYELIEMVQEYFNLRGKIDRIFDHHISSEDILDEDDYDEIDFWDDELLHVQWQLYGRCGDYDYFDEYFPIEHLWSDEWEADVKEQIKIRKEREERERKERERRAAEALERRERETLRKLLAKYPDEARS